jgi:hypothetical protein
MTIAVAAAVPVSPPVVGDVQIAEITPSSACAPGTPSVARRTDVAARLRSFAGRWGRAHAA